MANRRMLAKSISISEKVNDLNDFEALLFTWMIPHADDWGVLPGSARKIRSLVIPDRPQTSQDVDKALDKFADLKLIWRYEVDGKPYIQFRKWEEHQDGLHKRSKPKMPLYPGSSVDNDDISEAFPEIPGNSGLTEQNRTEQNLREQNVVIRNELLNELQKIRPISNQIESELVNDLISSYPGIWILNAIKLTIDGGGKTFGYVDAILSSWRNKYKDNDKPWEVEKHARNQQGARSRDKPSKASPAGSTPSKTDWENEPDHL